MHESPGQSDGVRIGTAGWAVPPQYPGLFPTAGTHLERYACRFRAVEINTSFYRPHRPRTYVRWAASVPDGFRFAVKLPREITHVRQLRDCAAPLAAFLSEAGALGDRLGPVLVQLPPRLAFDAETVAAFFDGFRARFEGGIVCEPRHASWFTDAVDAVLARFAVARVAADPAVVPRAAEPGGWGGLAYYRLHGSPHVYYSPYTPCALDDLAVRVAAVAMRCGAVWCVFDNTARGEAVDNALGLRRRLEAVGVRA